MIHPPDPWRNLSQERLKAMEQYCNQNDDHYAAGYYAIFEALYLEDLREDFRAMGGLKGAFGSAMSLWRAEAARAQAHQHFCFAEAESRGKRNYGFYTPAHFQDHPHLVRLEKKTEIAKSLGQIKDINIANGHGHLYK